MKVWREKTRARKLFFPVGVHANLIWMYFKLFQPTMFTHTINKKLLYSICFDLWMTLYSLIHFLVKGLVRRHADHSIGEVKWCGLLFLLTILVAYAAQHYHSIPSRDVMPSSQQPMRETSRQQKGRAVCECLDLSSEINQTGISPWGGDVCTDSIPNILHTVYLQNSQCKIRQSHPQVCHQEWLCDHLIHYNETLYTARKLKTRQITLWYKLFKGTVHLNMKVTINYSPSCQNKPTGLSSVENEFLKNVQPTYFRI